LLAFNSEYFWLAELDNASISKQGLGYFALYVILYQHGEYFGVDGMANFTYRALDRYCNEQLRLILTEPQPGFPDLLFFEHLRREIDISYRFKVGLMFQILEYFVIAGRLLGTPRLDSIRALIPTSWSPSQY